MTLEEIRNHFKNGVKVYYGSRDYPVKYNKKLDIYCFEGISNNILREGDQYPKLMTEYDLNVAEAVHEFELMDCLSGGDGDLMSYFDTSAEIDEFVKSLKGETKDEIIVDICEKLMHKGECTKAKEGEYLFKIEAFRERPEITYTIKLHDLRRD